MGLRHKPQPHEEIGVHFVTAYIDDIVSELKAEVSEDYSRVCAYQIIDGMKKYLPGMIDTQGAWEEHLKLLGGPVEFAMNNDASSAFQYEKQFKEHLVLTVLDRMHETIRDVVNSFGKPTTFVELVAKNLRAAGYRGKFTYPPEWDRDPAYPPPTNVKV